MKTFLFHFDDAVGAADAHIPSHHVLCTSLHLEGRLSDFLYTYTKNSFFKYLKSATRY